MTPEEQAQFNDMKERLRNIELAQNPDFVGSLEDVQIVKTEIFDETGLTGSIGSNENTRTTTIGEDGGTVTHLAAPDNFLFYRFKGKTYRLWANELV